MLLPHQGPVAVQRQQGQHWQWGQRHWWWRGWRVLANMQSWTLGDKLAGQGLGRRTSPRAGYLEDVLVESGERVEELCPKFVRGYGIKFLEI